MLAKRAGAAAEEAEKAEADEQKLEAEEREHRQGRRYSGKDVERSTSRRSSKSDDSWTGAIATVVAKELKGTTGRRLVRGILGGLFQIHINQNAISIKCIKAALTDQYIFIERKKYLLKNNLYILRNTTK